MHGFEETGSFCPLAFVVSVETFVPGLVESGVEHLLALLLHGGKGKDGFDGFALQLLQQFGPLLVDVLLIFGSSHGGLLVPLPLFDFVVVLLRIYGRQEREVVRIDPVDVATVPLLHVVHLPHVVALQIVQNFADLVADQVAQPVLSGQSAQFLGELDVRTDGLHLYLHGAADGPLVAVAEVDARLHHEALELLLLLLVRSLLELPLVEFAQSDTYLHEAAQSQLDYPLRFDGLPQSFEGVVRHKVLGGLQFDVDILRGLPVN